MLWLLILLISWHLPAQGQSLRTTFPFSLTLENLRNNTGQLCLAVFRSPTGFPDNSQAAALQDCFPISNAPTLTLTLDLPYSLYAIAVFHDENNNGQLDTGPFGIPREGFGFSNNPPIRFGAPSFEESRIVFSPQTGGTTIQLRYF
ncbi:MAG: DUF2141 domain-containing protein [Thermostichales cyanobacterium SZTDM-1c_bins_54]